MTVARFLKYTALAGCAAAVIGTVVLGFWPSVLSVTRAPLYAGFFGAWCVFAAICYLIFRFVREGLRRSKRW